MWLDCLTLEIPQACFSSDERLTLLFVYIGVLLLTQGTPLPQSI